MYRCTLTTIIDFVSTSPVAHDIKPSKASQAYKGKVGNNGKKGDNGKGGAAPGGGPQAGAGGVPGGPSPTFSAYVLPGQ